MLTVLLTRIKTRDMAFHCFTEGVEFADEAVAIFLGPGRKVRDEGFDQIPAGFFEGFSSAEVSCVGLNERGIQIVSANQEAELVTDLHQQLPVNPQSSHAEPLGFITNRSHYVIDNKGTNIFGGQPIIWGNRPRRSAVTSASGDFRRPSAPKNRGTNPLGRSRALSNEPAFDRTDSVSSLH
jgi:hypothetical protein